MKPFNLERAIAGDPVCTQNGQLVDEFHYFDKCANHQRIVCIINGALVLFDEKGFSYNAYELRMAPKIREGWIIVDLFYGFASSALFPNGRIFQSLEQAEGYLLQCGNQDSFRLIKIEWPE